MEPPFTMISAADGLPIAVHRLDPGGQVQARVVIAHGAAEHAKRYARFAAVLGQAGCEVLVPDHRGHGLSAGPAGLGDFGDAGWDGLVADLAQLIELALDRQPRVPVMLFAHSMGSFAAQDLCVTHSARVDALRAVVLSGSTAIERLPAGQRISDGGFNARFEPARTPYDWLSRDPSEVDRYIADPLCGFESRKAPVSAGPSWARLLDPQLFVGVRSTLPFLLLAGDMDPLNRQLAGLTALEQRLRDAGIARVDTDYYPGARHEMLNETNRDEVMSRTRDWLVDQCASG